MPKIFIVVGQTGEYSDRRDWNVVAYPDEVSANIHAAKAQEYADNHKDRYNLKNPYDPYMDMDYTGTFYDVEEVELITGNEIKS